MLCSISRGYKESDNCKGEPLFAIPLTQVNIQIFYDWSIHFHAFLKVYLPGLHISMGIFYKLYSLLEEECHLLDLRLSLQLSTNTGLTMASYEEYATAPRELTALKEQLEVLHHERISLKDLFNYSAMIVGEISLLLSSLTEEDISYSSKIAELVSYWILGNTCYPHANGCR